MARSGLVVYRYALSAGGGTPGRQVVGVSNVIRSGFLISSRRASPEASPIPRNEHPLSKKYPWEKWHQRIYWTAREWWRGPQLARVTRVEDWSTADEWPSNDLMVFGNHRLLQNRTTRAHPAKFDRELAASEDDL